jgi:hypothetical protein
MSYSEFTRLVICLTLDVVEYLVPFLLTPFVGDLLDIVGVATCLYLFQWYGVIAGLELIPGFDVLPINVVTWGAWLAAKRQRDRLARA